MTDRAWIDSLDDEDLAFLKRFLLASGTLKELARQYGISYPTVRLRLGRRGRAVRAEPPHGICGRSARHDDIPGVDRCVPAGEGGVR